MRWNHRTRRNLLIVISMFCLAAAAAMLYGRRDLGHANHLDTPAVAMLLGLMLLPGATFAARRAERRLRRTDIDHLPG